MTVPPLPSHNHLTFKPITLYNNTASSAVKKLADDAVYTYLNCYFKYISHIGKYAGRSPIQIHRHRFISEPFLFFAFGNNGTHLLTINQPYII